LDELLTWEEGTFTIKPKEISFDELVGSGDIQELSNLALVVSNSLVVRKLLERKLGEKGFVVKTAQNIATAGNLLQSDRPKVVIADTKFEDGNMGDLGKKVTESSDCPIVVISDGKIPDDVKAYLSSHPKSKTTNSHDINEVIQIVSSIG
jgi:DNA-binding NtrC family response regulator